MDIYPLGRADIFIDIVDYDQKKAGLSGNIVQLILHLESSPEKSLIEGVVSQAPGALLCRLFLESPMVGRRRWKLEPGTGSSSDFPFYLHNVRDMGCFDGVMDTILNTPVDLTKPPVFRLDLIESEADKNARLVLTWHHLLSDARGGEMLLRCLAVEDKGHAADSAALLHQNEAAKRQKGFWENLKEAKGFKPMVRRLKETGVIAPACSEHVSERPLLKSLYHVFDREESRRISERGRSVHPILGETALLLASCFRAVHSVNGHGCEDTGGYVAPVPLSTRSVAQAREGAWSPGNCVSICFVPVMAEDVERLDTDSLASVVARELREQVASGMPEAAQAAMEVARFFPKALYRWIMRNSMDGQLCSFYFSNTGPVAIGGLEGEPFDVCGKRVSACFHRPMVSQPPGTGFFFSLYDSRLHMTTCFIDGAVDGHSAQRLRERVCSFLV